MNAFRDAYVAWTLHWGNCEQCHKLQLWGIGSVCKTGKPIDAEWSTQSRAHSDSEFEEMMKEFREEGYKAVDQMLVMREAIEIEEWIARKGREGSVKG